MSKNVRKCQGTLKRYKSKKQVTPFVIMLTTPMAHIELSCFEKVCSPRNSYDTSCVTIIFFVNSGRTVFSLIYDFEIFQKSANMTIDNVFIVEDSKSRFISTYEILE